MENKSHICRPPTRTTQDNIDEIHRLIEDGCHFTMREVSEEIEVSYSNVHNIIGKELQFTNNRKV